MRPGGGSTETEVFVGVDVGYCRSDRGDEEWSEAMKDVDAVVPKMRLAN